MQCVPLFDCCRWMETSLIHLMDQRIACNSDSCPMSHRLGRSQLYFVLCVSVLSVCLSVSFTLDGCIAIGSNYNVDFAFPLTSVLNYESSAHFLCH